MATRKGELELQLMEENRMIKEGILRDESPLDFSSEFQRLCDACRAGDLKTAQQMILAGANINARDTFDYTPLILASLCGHYELVRLLLESGAICERDTFQGKRCIHNALNKKIVSLLLEYDYSKTADPLQPLAAHITSLLARRDPEMSDISVLAASESFRLHKFVLAARSPYFRQKLAQAPETTSWKLPSLLPAESFHVAIRYLYMGEIPPDLGLGAKSDSKEEDVLRGIDKISKQLEIEPLWELMLAGNDRRIARQRQEDELKRGKEQLDGWFRDNILKHKMEVDVSKADNVKWTRDNTLFADVLLRADEDPEDLVQDAPLEQATLDASGIPVGPKLQTTMPQKSRRCTLYPVHRAMLIRSEYFSTMFSSVFQEAQMTEYLQIIPVDCSPEVLEYVLQFLYTETAEIPLEYAVEALYAADMLFIEKLKNKVAVTISTLGDPTNKSRKQGPGHEEVGVGLDDAGEDGIDPYDVIRAAWNTRVQRLEEFAAQFFANRLEQYIDERDFQDLVAESAGRIQGRQETDTIELIDDIRYFLSERFRLRFEDVGLEDEEFGENPEGGETVDTVAEPIPTGRIRTLDGEEVSDEFEQDARNYEILLEKIDQLLERLNLDG